MPESQESSSSKPDEQCTDAELQERIDLLSFLSVTSLTKTDEDLYNDCKATTEEELSKRIKLSAARKFLAATKRCASQNGDPDSAKKMSY
jgi:hypothetical protein